MARSKNTVSHETDAGPALVVAEFPVAATGADPDARAKHVHTAEIAFPRKFHAGHVLTAEQAAQLDALHLRTYTGNYRSYVVRGGKSYTPEEILEAWNAYELGAPRERTGETLRHKAGYMFVQEWLAAKNAEREAAGQKPLPWPRAQKGKMTEEQASAAREAMIARALASENADTQRRIAEFEAQLRAEQAEARGRSEVASVDELTDATDF